MVVWIQNHDKFIVLIWKTLDYQVWLQNQELLSGRALRALLTPSTVLAGVVLAGSWFQSLMA
jgi:hypothetical protein